ncbi:MAG: hypothetical protein IPH82_09485 [Chloroflexi bacterium]|nr:hypothetical protein [Chloroflexota bacterium]
MEQIIIQVKDKEKAQLLSELLRSLDFVSLVPTDFQENDSGKTETDFFALGGIWQGRNIDLDTLRQQAWPK